MEQKFVAPMKFSFVYDHLSKYCYSDDCMALKVSDDEYRLWVNLDDIIGHLPKSGTVGSGYISSDMFGQMNFTKLSYRNSTQPDCIILRCYRN